MPKMHVLGSSTDPSPDESTYQSEVICQHGAFSIEGKKSSFLTKPVSRAFLLAVVASANQWDRLALTASRVSQGPLPRVEADQEGCVQHLRDVQGCAGSC